MLTGFYQEISHRYQGNVVKLLQKLREDTHKKSGLFSGRTTKRGGGVTPPTTKQKTTFFYKWRKFTGKLHNENIIL